MIHRNEIITDIGLAPRNANGNVEYMATFFLVKPTDMSRSSGLLWQYVPNRGGRITLSPERRLDGDVGLSSGWQGDRPRTYSARQPGSGHRRRADREEPRRLGDYRTSLGPHYQCRRACFEPDLRALKSDALLSRDAGHQHGESDNHRVGNDRWEHR